MIQISQQLLDKLQQPARTLRAEIRFDAVGEATLDDNVIQSFKMQEACNTGDDLTVGSCCCSTLEISLLNKDGALTGRTFTNQTIRPYIGMDVDGEPEWVPLGAYTVTEASKEENFVVTLKAVDAMAKFNASCEVIMDEDALILSTESGPAVTLGLETYTLADFLLALGEVYEFPGDFLADSMYTGPDRAVLGFPNAAYCPEAAMQGTISGRTMLSYAAQAAGSFARFDRNGKLEFAWYTNANASVNGNVYTSSEFREYEIPAVTALKVCAEEGDLGRTFGDGETYTMTGNPLLTRLTLDDDESWNGYMAAILDRIRDLRYQPYTLALQGNPMYQTGDIVPVTLETGENYACPVMSLVLSYNGGLTAEWSADGTNPEEEEAKGTIAEGLKNLNKRSNTFQIDLDSVKNTITDLTYRTTGQIDELSSYIAQTAQGFESFVGEQTEYKDILEERNTRMEQTVSGWEFSFSELKTQVDSDAEILAGLENRIRFVDGKIILATGDDSIQTVLSQDELSFWQGGEKVAYISDTKLYITNAEVLKSLQLGNFMFSPRGNNNLSFRKVK